MLYRVTIQTKSAEWNPEGAWILLKPYVLPHYGEDIEEETDTTYRVLFTSSLGPSEVKKNIAQALTIYGVAHYVDVLYRFPNEMFHDRFTVWEDGTAQEYITHSVYTEDGEREKVI